MTEYVYIEPGSKDVRPCPYCGLMFGTTTTYDTWAKMLVHVGGEHEKLWTKEDFIRIPNVLGDPTEDIVTQAHDKPRMASELCKGVLLEGSKGSSDRWVYDGSTRDNRLFIRFISRLSECVVCFVVLIISAPMALIRGIYRKIKE